MRGLCGRVQHAGSIPLCRYPQKSLYRFTVRVVRVAGVGRESIVWCTRERCGGRGGGLHEWRQGRKFFGRGATAIRGRARGQIGRGQGLRRSRRQRVMEYRLARRARRGTRQGTARWQGRCWRMLPRMRNRTRQIALGRPHLPHRSRRHRWLRRSDLYRRWWRWII